MNSHTSFFRFVARTCCLIVASASPAIAGPGPSRAGTTDRVVKTARAASVGGVSTRGDATLSKSSKARVVEPTRAERGEAWVPWYPASISPSGGGRTWCGDGWCEEWDGEDQWSCPDDCGYPFPTEYCGDGSCNSGEWCGSCPGDCGECPASCGDGWCNGGEDCSSCSGDCGECVPAPYCGDGQCAPGAEDCGTCLQDCPCWMDGTSCNASGYPGQCVAFCGNGVCGSDESCTSCSQDCGQCAPVVTCGDGTCNGQEDCNSCSNDCGGCPPPEEPTIDVYADGFLVNESTLQAVGSVSVNSGSSVEIQGDITIVNDATGAVIATQHFAGGSYASGSFNAEIPGLGPVASFVEPTSVLVTLRVVVAVGVVLAGLFSFFKSKTKKVEIRREYQLVAYALDTQKMASYLAGCYYKKLNPCAVGCAGSAPTELNQATWSRPCPPFAGQWWLSTSGVCVATGTPYGSQIPLACHAIPIP